MDYKGTFLKLDVKQCIPHILSIFFLKCLQIISFLWNVKPHCFSMLKSPREGEAASIRWSTVPGTSACQQTRGSTHIQLTDHWGNALSSDYGHLQ